MSSFGIWEKMVCLALLLSVSLCCLLSAFLSTPSALSSFPHPSVSLEVLPVSLPVCPFAILIFSLCVSKSPYHHLSLSKSPSRLWIPFHLFSASPRTSRVIETSNISATESLWKRLCLFFLQLALGKMNRMNLTPWPGLWLLSWTYFDSCSPMTVNCYS